MNNIAPSVKKYFRNTPKDELDLASILIVMFIVLVITVTMVVISAVSGGSSTDTPSHCTWMYVGKAFICV